MFSGNDKHIIKNIIVTYLEPEHWNLVLTVTDDVTLLDIRKNILQVCLQTEGIGISACALQKEFEFFMLKCLYLILERAGVQYRCLMFVILFNNVSFRFKSSSYSTGRLGHS